MSKGKHFCFTSNNPSEEDLNKLAEIAPQCQFLIYQLEVGESKTPHIQGFISFPKDTYFRNVQKILSFLSSTPHIETAKGSPLQNRVYCSKAEGRIKGPFEFGELPVTRQGRRSDLEGPCQDIKDGASIVKIASDYPSVFVKHYRGLQALKDTIAPIPSRSSMPVVSVYYGRSGTGKSARALAEATRIGGSVDQVYLVDHRANGQVDWSGYNQQKCVIFNDFYGGMQWSHLLRLCDRYGHKVSALYKSIDFTSTHIFFTSNKHPRYWYKNVDDPTPFFRRLTHLLEMNNRDFTYSADIVWMPATPPAFVERSAAELEQDLCLRSIDTIAAELAQPTLSRADTLVVPFMFSEERNLFLSDYKNDFE